ncbi:hypothetical protein BH24ACT15_BH24ACT15_15520 [soil metagenome]
MRNLLMPVVLLLLVTACGGADAVGPGELRTGPIPVEPDGGIGDGAGPPGRQSPPPPPQTQAPPFGVSTETDSAAVPPFSYCWAVADTGPGVCADGFPNADTELAADARLVITYEEGQLTAEYSDPIPEDPSQPPPPREPLPVQLENPGIWVVDVSALDQGQHTVWLSWRGDQGDSAAAVTVSITR